MRNDHTRRIYVRLNESDIDLLVRRAERERRQPADEGGLILAQALRRRRGELATADAPEAGHVDDD